MKHALSLLFFFVLIPSINPMSAKDFAGGTGTETNPYLITTPQELSNLRNYLGSEYRNTYFKIENDINLSSFSATVWGDIGWMPIGTLYSPFCGILDGNGCTIGFTINNLNYLGLFGVIGVDGGTCPAYIKNLNIQCSIKGYDMCGGIAGFMGGGTRIENCSAECQINGGNYIGGLIGSGTGTIDNCQVKDIWLEGKGSYIGGLVGNGGGSITNCSVNTKLPVNGSGNYIGGIIGYCDLLSIQNCNVNSTFITGSISGIGGLVGCNSKSLSISNCHTNSTIMTGVDYVGGLIGSVNGSLAMSNCSAETNQIAGNYYVGGLVGYMENGFSNQCFSTCKLISGNVYVGGLVGASSDASIIGNCYASGSVMGISYIGGLIGFSGSSVVTSYSSCQVSATGNYSGAFLGYRKESSLVSNCYYLRPDYILEDNNNGAKGLTDAEMKSKNNFAGFNFSEIWDIYENESYPFLRCFEDESSETSLENVPINTIHAYVSGNILNINGLVKNRQLFVYNLSGQPVYNSCIADENLRIHLPYRGIYIIKYGKESVKIIY